MSKIDLSKIDISTIKAIKKCEDIDACIDYVKENCPELGEDEAKKLFELTHSSRELSDDEISNVSGGTWDDPNWYPDRPIIPGGK